MLTPTLLTLLVLLGSTVLLMLIALLWNYIRRRRAVKPTTVRRSVVYLVSGSRLLVMQQGRKGRLRERLEVPKGKAMHGETALDAAYRECGEESGLRPTDLEFLMSFQTRQRKGKRRSVETWDAFWGSVPTGTTVPLSIVWVERDAIAVACTISGLCRSKRLR